MSRVRFTAKAPGRKGCLFLAASAGIFFWGILLFAGCKSPPPLPEPPPQEEAVEPQPELPPDPRASLKFLSIEAREPSKVTLNFILEAENPRSEAAEFGIESQRVEINGQEMNAGFALLPEENAAVLGTGGQMTGGQLALPPGETAEIPLRLEMDLPALAAGGLSLMEDLSVEPALSLSFSYGSGTVIQADVRESAVFTPVREPVFTITSIAVLKAELVNTRFRVTVKVDNPNPFPVDVSSFVYELYGEGRFWADGAEKDVFQVPPGETREIQLFLLMNFIDMSRSLLDTIIRLENVSYRFAGEAVVATGIEYLPRFTTAFDLSGFSRVLEN